MLWVLIVGAHNIGFYEDLTKILFELSSNIIKYAPYFFCWAYKYLGCITEEIADFTVQVLNKSIDLLKQAKMLGEIVT